MNFGNCPYVLSNEIEKKRNKGLLFPETDLWYLLYILAAAKNDMSSSSPKIGDVRPHNIFLNGKGEAKVANLLSWPEEFTNYLMAVTYDEKGELSCISMDS